MNREWRKVPNFPGYEVSNLGEVRSFWQRRSLGRGLGTQMILSSHATMLKQQPDYLGYRKVTLCRSGQKFTKKVHHLVAEAFIRPMNKGEEVRHGNDISYDNRLENLSYGSRSDNEQDKAKNKRGRNLTEEERQKIYTLLDEGKSPQEIAAIMNCTDGCIRGYRNGRIKDNRRNEGSS